MSFRIRPVLRAAGVLAVLLSALSVAATPRVHAQQCGTTIRGSSQGIVGCAQLHAGLLIVHVRSNGSQNFAAELETQDPSATQPLAQDPSAYKDVYSLYNTIGAVDGAAAVMLRNDNTYYLHVTYASGPYEFTFDQPSPATVTPVNQASFTASMQQVTPIFSHPAGPVTVNVQSDSTALKLWLYQVDDLGGRPVPPDADPNTYEGHLFDNTGGPFTQSIAVTLPADGLYLFYVYPDGTGSMKWSVAIG